MDQIAACNTSVLVTTEAVNPGIGEVLVLGGGYTGQRFATALAGRGASVHLTSRRADLPASAGGLQWHHFDPAEGQTLTLPEGLSHVLITIPPDSEGLDPVLSHLLAPLRERPLQWVGYLSTTGVYGDTHGAWVEEASPTEPGLARSQARLRCEQAWLNAGLPLQSFRLPAIYGPGRSPFQQLLEGKARLVHKPGQVFCRIHVDDIVGALLHCLALPGRERPAVVNISDACPCPSSETLSFAAHLLGCKLPPLQRYEAIAAAMGPMARSFWSENRRVSNRLLCEHLGYALRYPSYREGFQACWREERSGSASEVGR